MYNKTDQIALTKQTQYYVLKVWCTCIGISPVLFTFLMINNIKGKRDPVFEAFVVITITIVLGIFYFLPSLLLTLVINRYVVKSNMKLLTIKIVNFLCLSFLIGTQLLFLYENNLSLIYQGTGAMVLSYVIILFIASLFYKLTFIHSD